MAFKLSERLKKLHDRPDHFLAREQFVIIVIGVGQHEEHLGSNCGDRRTIAAGGSSTARSIATAVPSDSPKYTIRDASTSGRARSQADTQLMLKLADAASK